MPPRKKQTRMIDATAVSIAVADRRHSHKKAGGGGTAGRRTAVTPDDAPDTAMPMGSTKYYSATYRAYLVYKFS